MFQSYEQIFKKRAEAYHKAMELFPAARDREFQLAIDTVDIKAGEVVCDAPSGGGYLRAYLPAGIQRYLAVETASGFAGHCPTGTSDRIIRSPLDNLGIEDNSVDILINLAGSHHIEDKTVFFHEAARILRSGGRFVITDAEAGTSIDRFLNQFVDQNSSMGHEGIFLGQQTSVEMAACEFKICSDELIRYPWSFDSRADMAVFCKLLFGMDLAEPECIIQGIENVLGYMPGPGKVNMAWCLRRIVAIKS